jgi:hypothetical protein
VYNQYGLGADAASTGSGTLVQDLLGLIKEAGQTGAQIATSMGKSKLKTAPIQPITVNAPATDISSYLPYILGGVVVVGLLIFVLKPKKVQPKKA